ncbi:MAG: hypothetical protein CMC08_09790, partial [Flavobacteriaceae bacterium]|nr:hypothetical protein [Flavobacteriaceae bacterium]
MFVDFVLIAGMSLLFLLAVFLLKSNTGFPKKLLSVFFINSIFFLLYYYGYLHKSHIVGGIAILFGSGAGFLLGPFLLFYIRSLIWPRQKVLSALKLHLIPFAIYWLLVSLPIALSLGAGLLRSYHEQYVLVADYVNLLENIYFFSYTLVTLRWVARIK